MVTIVAHDREELCDDPVFRRAAETMWQRIPRHFLRVELDERVVMPNHIQEIIVIVDGSLQRLQRFRRQLGGAEKDQADGQDE